MTTDSPRAARYFPFRDGPDPARIVHNAPDTDRAAQSRAVRQASAHDRALLVARPLWWSPLLIVATVGTGYWWVGVAVTAVCALAIWLLGRAARRTRDEVRLADGTIGIPVPDSLADEIVATGKSMHQMGRIWSAAGHDEVLFRRVKPYERELAKIDDRYVYLLHEARRLWVADDLPAWAEAALQLPVLADRVRPLLAAILAP
ncbi:hypothetical protein [Streptomyces sp. NL15-2K]|uniref:hypothetical protein n=1 Tax=Streptomyces sp. NL15-2K TaxID=376149 RepID=UPI000F55DDEA|nr:MULTISPECIES: hypothetical protein [Actinomycetes]WKX11056.1 hypothetical protein Q4V64_27525 [Kutzneria buriramensis]GCB52086.1 hypothetical protein SNL152K_9442 [Streptomyces sp. NL15-2K]